MVSRHGDQVFFCVFDAAGKTEMSRFALPLRLGDVHYGFIGGIKEGTRYGLRASGPWDHAKGHRFDPSKLLLDPYALSLDGPFKHHPALTERGTETAALVPKAVVLSIPADAAALPPHRPGFIYEVQVRAFTRLHPKIPTEKRGTIAALAEPVIIEHLQRLGADTIELMPITAWIGERHLAALGLTNAWGYNPISYFAPDPRLAPGGLAELRTTVDALHRVGIRVILDVVFNHTGESDEFGATLSLRGLDNALYYRHSADGRLVNDSGCGNTLALDRTANVQLAMDAMRGFVTRCGIDGFRFDLAPVMGRGETGFDVNAPLLAAIEQDPLLSTLIMIAEPWDLGKDGYRLGAFPARWREWNDHYRDDVRRFWRGDANAAGAFATRIAGSSDIFGPHRRPSSSINYVAAHDGFTLKDTVTYLVKNNFANGEGNRDGNAHEATWPGGDVRALLATLFLSRGTPMLTAGDEFGRTQLGNNNAYAQDNETTWLNWVTADQSLIDFTAALAALRRAWPLLAEDIFLTGQRPDIGDAPDASWLGADGGPMNWHDPQAHVIGLVLSNGGARLALWFNRGQKPVVPLGPRRDGQRWTRHFCSADGANLPPQAMALYAEERVQRSGISDGTLKQLATEAGIERDWWEVGGTHHEVTPETLRAVLAALRLAHANADDVETSRRSLREHLAPLIGDARAPVKIAELSSHRRRLNISSEDGAIRGLDAQPGEAVRTALSPGYYDVWSDDVPDSKRRVIVSPGRCYLPDDIARGARVFGLASHLYALRHKGDGGIGDFATLRRFAEMTHAIGGRYAGLNPLHHLFPSDRSRASPYQPSDRRFIDPIYISIGQLLKHLPLPKAMALAQRSRAAFAKLERLSNVDYQAVWSAKEAIFEAGFAEFTGDPAYQAFTVKGGDDLMRHGRFEAWFAGESATPQRIAYRSFLQWIAEHQLGAAAKQNNLYRDLALGCAFDGGEISEAPEHFAEGVSIGAPPDPFSAAGQVWNLPPFSPVALAAENLAPMRAILTANMRHAAALRIDHILGFARQFWVPRGAEGRFGAYVKFPIDALIAVTAIESQRHRCLVVGEDLGTIPEGLREQLAAADIFSYRVLWFERGPQGFKPPELYPAHALACLASHDLPTFMGWRAGRDIELAVELGQVASGDAETRKAERAHEILSLDRLAGVPGAKPETASAAAHGLLARTPCRVMLIQADDLAGETEPLNVPGTDTERPNWRRRLGAAVDDLTSTPLVKSIVAAVKAERPS